MALRYCPQFQPKASTCLQLGLWHRVFSEGGIQSPWGFGDVEGPAGSSGVRQVSRQAKKKKTPERSASSNRGPHPVGGRDGDVPWEELPTCAQGFSREGLRKGLSVHLPLGLSVKGQLIEQLLQCLRLRGLPKGPGFVELRGAEFPGLSL